MNLIYKWFFWCFFGLLAIFVIANWREIFLVLALTISCTWEWYVNNRHCFQ